MLSKIKNLVNLAIAVNDFSFHWLSQYRSLFGNKRLMLDEMTLQNACNFPIFFYGEKCMTRWGKTI